MDDSEKINIGDSVNITESVSITIESEHLLVSNKNNVKKILSKNEINQNDLIDVFFGLHLILEIGINFAFRHILDLMFGKNVFLTDSKNLIDHLDKVSFIDKTKMFIFFSDFDNREDEKFIEYLSIIDLMMDFSNMRNSIIHGHSIKQANIDGKNVESKLFRKINHTELDKKLKNFEIIMDGLGFYLDSLKSDISENEKQIIKNNYLDKEFLPKLRI